MAMHVTNVDKSVVKSMMGEFSLPLVTVWLQG